MPPTRSGPWPEPWPEDVKKLRTGVLGAPGLAGQQVVAALQGHPWFVVTALAASERSAGKPYGEALRGSDGASRWFADGSADPSVESLVMGAAADLVDADIDLV